MRKRALLALLIGVTSLLGCGPPSEDGAGAAANVALEIKNNADTTSCPSLVNNTITIPAGKTVSDDVSDPTLWNLGAVSLEFAACQRSGSQAYEILPDVVPMKVENYTVNLQTRSQGPQTTYVPTLDQGQVPNFGHGLIFESLTKAPTRHPKEVPGYILRLRFMSCSEKPLSLKDVGLQSLKAVASLPLPISYVKALGQYGFTLIVPDPEKEYQCEAVGDPLDVRFHLGPDGKAVFSVPGRVTMDYSYKARRKILFDLYPVRVNVTLEAQMPSQAD